MKPSTFAKSALALSFGMFAGAVLANTTVTPITENFTGKNGQVPGSNLTSDNLTWAAGSDDASIVENEKLTIDTGSAAVTATIASDVATAINTSAQDSSLGATFTATVTFVPATEDPDVTGSDLKFALYAKAVEGATNLYVIANGGATNNTGIALTNVTAQDIEIAFTAANTFTVKVGNSTSSEFSFVNNGDISKIEFQGNGTVDNIGFAYIKAVTVYGDDTGAGEQPTVTIANTTHTLTAAEAAYLNGRVIANGYSNETVENAIKDLSEAQFADAVLLNQDVVTDGAAAASNYTFTVTGVKKSGNQVIVDVALNRTGTVLGAITGTVTLYSATTPNGTYTKQASAEFETNTADGTAATQTYTATFSNVSGNFFKATIE